jgi:fatty acid/phospholipid biosynthesis enzyme
MLLKPTAGCQTSILIFSLPFISSSPIFSKPTVGELIFSVYLTAIEPITANSTKADFKAGLDPGQYNGASLLGLRGIVIKSHGGADVDSFFQAIKEAYLEVQVKTHRKPLNQHCLYKYHHLQ